MLGALSLTTLVMACCAGIALATESPVLRCPQHASRDQCDEVSHNRFRLNNVTTVEFFFEVEQFIKLALDVSPVYVDYMMLDLGRVLQYLPRFQPALRVHNVTVMDCFPTNYAALFDTLNVQLVTPFDLTLDNTGRDRPMPLRAEHFANLPPLRHFKLQRGNSKLRGRLFPSLESLTMEHSSLLNNTLLKELPLTLTKLRLFNVDIRRVPAAVLNLPELRSLYVGDSLPWRYGDVTVERGNASQLQELYVYTADGALLSEWAPPVLEEVTLVYWQAERPAPVPVCDKLVKLKLYYPCVIEFPSGWVARCPHLKELHIEDAKNLRKLPEPAGFLENATHLTSFSIRGTDMSSLPEHLFTNTPNLSDLDLSHNKLTQLQPQIFVNTPHLTHLNLNYNQLTQLQSQLFANTPHLTHLNLNYNQLTQLQSQLFANTPHLTHLDLMNNNLKQLQPQIFVNTPNLTHLDLSENVLQLQPEIFANTPHLTDLDLSSNQLTQLPPQIFANTPHLTDLDLSFNRLTQLPSSMMKLPLLSLDLRYNLLNASVKAELAAITELRNLSLVGNKGAQGPQQFTQVHQGDDSNPASAGPHQPMSSAKRRFLEMQASGS